MGVGEERMRHRISLGLLLCLGVAPSAAAQTDSQSRTWRPVWRVTVDGEYSNNVFLLSPGRMDDVTTPPPGTEQSGRFADMESPSDMVTTGEIGVGLRARGVAGRSLDIIPEAGYVFYARNSKRSHARFGVTIEQDLPHGARFRVRGTFQPSSFSRNYLADAVDADGNGTITEAERVYEPGARTSAGISADYRFRLKRSTRRSPLGVAVELNAGYAGRTFDAPFEIRTRKGPTAGAEILLDLGRRVRLDLGYGFGREGATPGDARLVLDEPDVRQDLNGNGSVTDENVLLVRTVDLSRNSHAGEATLEIAVARGADLAIAYGRRWREYLSAEVGDLGYNGRRDTRNELDVALDLRLAPRLHLEIGGSMRDQNTNRPGDVGGIGDDDDYRALGARLGLAFQR